MTFLVTLLLTVSRTQLVARTLVLALTAPPEARQQARRAEDAARRARGEETVWALAELCGVESGGRAAPLAEAVRAYVAQPACSMHARAQARSRAQAPEKRKRPQRGLPPPRPAPRSRHSPPRPRCLQQ